MFEWFVALRYLRAKHKHGFISLISFISVAGITVGVIALIVVLAVYSGFTEGLRDQILGVNSHIIVRITSYNVCYTKLLRILLVSTWLLLFGVLPLLLLIVASFLAQDPIEFFRLSFSLESYEQILNSSYLSVLLRSVKLATLTTIACLACGYPFAWYTVRLSYNFV